MTSSATPQHIARGKSAEHTDLIIARRHHLVTSLARPAGGTLLDFGCGNGAQTALFEKEFARVVGVDVDERSLATFARRVTAGGNVLPVCYDGSTLPLQTASVDYAVSFEVLEHVHHETRALEELHRVLKPGARLAMSVPNKWWVFETHGAELPVLKWNRVPFFSWLPRSLHDRWARARIYTRGEIADKLRRAGFDVQHSLYITAPMDVVRHPGVQEALRRFVFRGDRTSVPFFSTAVLVIATRRDR